MTSRAANVPSRGGLAALVVALGVSASVACGGPDVPLQTLVPNSPAAADAASFLADLAEALQETPCAVGPAITARTSRFSPAAEADVRLLSNVARQACALGLTTPLQRDAQGRWRFSLGTEGLRQVNGVLLADAVGTGVHTVRLDRRPAGAGTPSEACGVVRGDGAAATVWLGPHAESLPLHLRRADRAPVSRWVAAADDGESLCALDTGGGLVLPAAEGGRARLWQIWEVPEDTDADEARSAVAVELRIDGGDEDATPASVGNLLLARVEQEIQVGPFTTPARALDAGCSGFVGADPTTVFRLDRQRRVDVIVRSGADPVLAIVGPTGEVWCVDDTNGLNPALQLTFGPGTYRVYVGSFGRGASFSATLLLEPI